MIHVDLTPPVAEKTLDQEFELPVYYDRQQVMKILHIKTIPSLCHYISTKRIPEPLRMTRTHWLWEKNEFDNFLTECKGKSFIQHKRAVG